MFLKFYIKKFDWLMFLIVCLMLTTSFFFIWSSSSAAYAWKQLVWIVAGMSVFFCLLVMDYSKVARYSYFYYLLILTLLLLVLLVGNPIHGSRRWFSMGKVSFQPSEFMKIVYVLAFSKYMSYKREKDSIWNLLVPLALTIIPVVLIAKQPDLGSSLILLPIFCAILFAAGTKLRYLLTLIGIGISAVPLLWLFLLKSYQKIRITGFLLPNENSDWGAGYQRLQSLIAVGSGGLFGRGWGNGVQSQLNFVPEQHTDFIFSIISEEFGFFRACSLLGLYMLFLLCGLGIAIKSRDPLGRLIVVGFMAMFVTQIFVNVGMTLGISPITGLTLPFMSYGGSSMISSFLALAFIINVRTRSKIVFAKEELMYL